jgi:hypothetical protein
MTPENVTPTVDAGMITIAAATFFGWLPNIAALLSVVWLLIRIWETETVRGWVRREQKSHDASMVRQADRKAEADAKEKNNGK